MPRSTSPRIMSSPLTATPLESNCDQTPPGAVRPRKVGVEIVAGETIWSSDTAATLAFRLSWAACAGVSRAVKPLNTVSNCVSALPALTVDSTNSCLLRR